MKATKYILAGLTLLLLTGCIAPGYWDGGDHDHGGGGYHDHDGGGYHDHDGGGHHDHDGGDRRGD